MKIHRLCALLLALGLLLPDNARSASIEKSVTGASTTSSPSADKCEQRLPPIGLYDAANNLLDAAYYAQWVLEDIICKYPENEEAKRAIAKLNRAIEKAEGR